MAIPASRSKLFEDLATLVFGLSVALALWQPALRWPIWIGIAALVLALVIRPFVDTEADRTRRRKSLWVIPVALAALAVQFAWTANADGRLRTVVLSTLLAVAGAALYLQRRRVK